MSVFERVKESVSIHQELDLDPNQRHLLVCPFHDDTDPSLHIFQDGNYKCFACGAFGDVIAYVAQMNAISALDAAYLLAEEHGLELDELSEEEKEAIRQARLKQLALTFGASFFERTLLEEGTASQPWRYLTETRSYSAEVLARWRVGYCPPGSRFTRAAQALVAHNQDKGLTLGHFRDVGLLSESKKGTWQDTFTGRVTFPYMDRRGRVLYIDARVIGTPVGSEPKFLGTRGDKPSFYPNPDFKRGGEAFLLEGITDTLAAMSWGVEARGVPGVAKFSARPLVGLKRITFLYDNDPAGEKAVLDAIVRTVQINPTGDICLLRLPPDFNDFSDWAKHHTKADLTALLPAKHAVQVLLDTVAAAGSENPVEKGRLLEPVYRILAACPAVVRDEYVKTIQKALKINAAASREAIKAAIEVAPAGKAPEREDEPEYKVVYDTPPTVHPTQNYHFDEETGTATMAVYQMVRTREGDLEKQPYLIQAHFQDGRLSVFDPTHISRCADLTSEVIDRLPDKTTVWNRWRGHPQYKWSYTNFCKGIAPTVEPNKVFWDLVDLTRRFIWLKDPRYHFVIASYIMMTYIHRLFPALPYLHLNGIAGSGKNQLLSLFNLLSFNAEQSALSTPAALSRTIEVNLSTFLFDEAEQLNDPKPGTMAEAVAITLNSGYRSDGRRKVTEALPGGGWTTKEFSTFSPKVLASIQPLNATLTSRCIVLRMRTAKKEVLAGIKDFGAERYAIEHVLMDLRDRLYCWAMGQFYEVERVRRTLQRDPEIDHLVGRQRDIWFPLLVMARHCSDEIPKEDDLAAERLSPYRVLMGLQVDSERDTRTWATDDRFDLEVLSILHETLRFGEVPTAGDSKGETFIPLGDLARKVTEHLIERDAIKVGKSLTSKRLMGMLRRLEFGFDRKDLFHEGRKVRCVRIVLDDLADLIATIGGEVSETAE